MKTSTLARSSTLGSALILLALLATAAAVSASTSKIAFHSDRDGNLEIYVMDTDGSNQTRLTDSPGEDLNPMWSPDGRHIAFTSNRDGNYEIYLMGSDGSDPTRLTFEDQDDRAPTWSPDGTRIAFMSTRGRGHPNYWEIYVMDADGSNPTQLTSLSGVVQEGQPAWSPDGSLIAFSRGWDSSREIWVMSPDGSGQTQITFVYQADLCPAWSPDGSLIAFNTQRHYYYAPQLYVMDADGSNQQRLLNTTSSDQHPSWSPDGNQIAFDSNRDGDFEIYVMEADGSDVVQLTFNSAYEGDPNWSPELAPLAAFSQFTLNLVDMRFSGVGGSNDHYRVCADLTLGSSSDGVDLPTEEVTVEVGPVQTIIPAGSFTNQGSMYGWQGEVDGSSVIARFEDQGSGDFDFCIEASALDLNGFSNPVEVHLMIGDDAGSQTVRLAGRLSFEAADSAADLVENLIGMVKESDLQHKRPLLASLEAALASIERGSQYSAKGQLVAFQNKVGAQVYKRDPAFAMELILGAEEIIAALEAGDWL